jgi:hypothetical protein
MDTENIKNELLKKIINKIISYSKLNLIEYVEDTIIKLNNTKINSPLKYCCYSEKYSIYNIDIENDIKEVIMYLLNKCNLSIMEVYETHDYRETIFDILNKESNTMTSIIKNNIYNYLLINCKENILQDYENMLFNLKTQENIVSYKNKMMFIMCNYNKETFDLIIKLLCSKKIITYMNIIVISLFSEEYINNCYMKKFDFSKSNNDIINLMIDNVYGYVDKINIYNLLNFIWSVIENTKYRNEIVELLKIVMWKYIIIEINKLMLINNEKTNNFIINFTISLDINTIHILNQYLKINDKVF